MKKVLLSVFLLFPLLVDAQIEGVQDSKWRFSQIGITWSTERDQIRGFGVETFKQLMGDEAYIFEELELAQTGTFSGICENRNFATRLSFTNNFFEFQGNLFWIGNKVDLIEYSSGAYTYPNLTWGERAVYRLSAKELGCAISSFLKVPIWNHLVFRTGIGLSYSVSVESYINIDASKIRNFSTTQNQLIQNTDWILEDESSIHLRYNNVFQNPKGIGIRAFLESQLDITIYKGIAIGALVRYGIGKRNFGINGSVGTNLRSWGIYVSKSLIE
ncbi:MAG: hypothetical protein AAFY71_17485 [Bacteroidota bacterium]